MAKRNVVGMGSNYYLISKIDDEIVEGPTTLARIVGELEDKVQECLDYDDSNVAVETLKEYVVVQEVYRPELVALNPVIDLVEVTTDKNKRS